MSDVFRAIHARDVAAGIEEVLLPRLTEALRDRVPGHCMRVSDLDSDLMAALARTLRSQATRANVHVLTDDAVSADDDLHISSTKLVELRNPLPDGTLRPPLCVFLPANLRTSAEDSFGSATFEEFPVGDVYDALRLRLLERIPSTLRGYVQDVLQLLREERWRWADTAAQVRYLLCAQANGNDAEAFGAALYEVGLVPDFKLFDQPTGARGRVRKNHECLRRLTDGDTSVLGRVLGLDLANQGMRRRLAEYLDDAGVEDPVAWTRNVVLDRKNWDLSFDKWEFEAEIAPERIAFVRVETDLPVVADDEHENERLADTINAFNPGRATVLADALAALQRQEALRDLRYDVRLFVPDPNAPGVGESIDALLAGGGTSAGEAFSTPTGSRIFPSTTRPRPFPSTVIASSSARDHSPSWRRSSGRCSTSTASTRVSATRWSCWTSCVPSPADWPSSWFPVRRRERKPWEWRWPGCFRSTRVLCATRLWCRSTRISICSGPCRARRKRWATK